MPISPDAWLGPIRREYIDTFVPAGGGAVRFVVGEDATLAAVDQALEAAAVAAGLTVVRIDTAFVKLHMLHQALFAIARSIDWERLTQSRLEALATEAGYAWPVPGVRTSLAALAAANGVAPTLLRTTLQQHITQAVWNDPRLSHDFRKAMIALLDSQLGDPDDALREGVLAWLRGDLRTLKAVRPAQIGQRIGRQNARAMLMSVCHWLRSCGDRGLLVLLDVRQMLRERRELEYGIVYTPAAVMDCYEVLRQVIDDAEHFEGLFLVALGGKRLVDDELPKRSIGSYTALKMRVWDDVRPHGRDNPLAPLVMAA